MASRETHIPGISGIGQEFYTRFGVTSLTWRRAAWYDKQRSTFVVKITSHFLKDVTLREVQKEQDEYRKAAKYLPVVPTLFVLTRDNTGKKVLVRIQKYSGDTLARVSDERLHRPEVRKQLNNIVRGMNRMVRETGEIPDAFGAPDTLQEATEWPSLRTSKNIVIDEHDIVRFCDVTTPELLRYVTTPLGQLHKNVFSRAIEKFKTSGRA